MFALSLETFSNFQSIILGTILSAKKKTFPQNFQPTGKLSLEGTFSPRCCNKVRSETPTTRVYFRLSVDSWKKVPPRAITSSVLPFIKTLTTNIFTPIIRGALPPIPIQDNPSLIVVRVRTFPRGVESLLENFSAASSSFSLSIYFFCFVFIFG